MSLSFHSAGRAEVTRLVSPLRPVGRPVAILLALLLAGCEKKDVVSTNLPPPAVQQSTAPGPASRPVNPVVIAPADNGDINATLAQLTRELRRTMVGRRLNRNFDEFIALRNLQVPMPPPGKEYGISAQWKVVLVNN